MRVRNAALAVIAALAADLPIMGTAAAQQPPAAAQPAGDRYRDAWADRYAPSATAIYLTIGGRSYDTLIYRPQGWTAADRRPAIVLFFAGGWRNGSPWQFAPFADHFSKAGYVVLLPNYRVTERDGTTIVDSTRDARSALRWVKAQAAELGVDPGRVIAGGGSAGGHLAAAAPGVGLDNPGEDPALDPSPAALLLFNPAVRLEALASPESPGHVRLGISEEQFRAVDPFHHIGPGYPPCIIFHGTKDRVVPFPSAEAFADKVRSLGGRCEVAPFEGRDHGFFNLTNGETDWSETVRLSERFLAGLGLVPSTRQ